MRQLSWGGSNTLNSFLNKPKPNVNSKMKQESVLGRNGFYQAGVSWSQRIKLQTKEEEKWLLEV